MPNKELFAKTVLRGVLEAVSYLHHQNLCHGYINPENVLFVSKSQLGSQNSLPIRLSESFCFNSSQQCDWTELCAMISENYQVASRSKCPAPEIADGTNPGPKSDV